MNTAERLELTRWVVKQTQAKGAADVAATLSHSRSITVEVRDQEVDRLRESTSSSLSIEVYVDGRYSAFSTSDLRRNSLADFLAEAVAMTRYLAVDPERGLPDPKYYEGMQKIDLQTADETYHAFTSDERVALALQTEKAARSMSDKIITCSAAFGDELGEEVRVHSNGFEGTRRGTEFGLWTEVAVRGEGEARPSNYQESSVRFRKDLASPEQIARQAVDRSLAMIGQKKLASGRYDLVIENRAASRMIGILTGGMRAANIQQKRSFLADKLGEKVASDKLTMIDDPFIVGGFGSRLYDSDGMATKRRVMIDHGVLKEFYVNYYYARKLGMEPTTGGSTNTVFEYGTHSLEDLVAGLKRGILVTGFIGGNSNAATGDFSVGVIGQYVENGKRVHPVHEMNIAGNILDFMNQLAEMGNDPYPGTAFRRPSMYFTDVQFAGL